ncbi:hypothetical protein SPBR_01906 [Sporothrix brasiliensis 5110]|uniref:EKC/KEOPS complex subunit BUD32 n=1 Tax=Sporothrix brasiliensis 5110 TaxID=1398154 RepID=A0A0C2IX96_9PEZI|nr:uncharacterized protein SPBR_01906 [Sporothrix brasiliensis 5110]KIH91390.1 hypothetical protein SPBR_01906 [Sporothrix brasiliensis 5110]
MNPEHDLLSPKGGDAQNADGAGATGEGKVQKPTELSTSRRSIGRGGFGSVTVMPCGTRIVKTAREGGSPHNHKFSMRTILREASVYLYLPPHERLLPFYGSTATPESVSITLGYCKKGNLYDHLEKNPDTKLMWRMLWCVDATQGLAHLHRHGVLHCDLRPDNLLIGDDDRLRIIDFGGSSIDGETNLAAEAEGYFLPRPAPWPCTPDTDRFALGSTFYHILTGHRPHQDRAPQDDITASFERGEYPADADDLLIRDIIYKCWKCEYKHTVDVFYELVPFMDQFRDEAIKDAAEKEAA